MRILITAGPTREYIDSVRYLSNASTGKMGFAIAASGLAKGHEVILISGPVDIPAPDRAELIRVTSAQEMLEAAQRRFGECQAAVMTAAVCDFRPRQSSATKIAKSSNSTTLELEPTTDICAHLGKTKKGRAVVGFALEDHDHRQHAQAKLESKQCDAVILNSVATVGADSAEIEIVQPGGVWSGPFSGSKMQISQRIIEFLEQIC